MTAIDPLVIQIPQELTENPATEEYFVYLHGIIRDLITAVIGDTTTVSDANASVASNAAAIAALTDSLPVYTITNDTENRTLDADSATAATGIDVADAGPELVVKVTEFNALKTDYDNFKDVVATYLKDAQAKDLIG